MFGGIAVAGLPSHGFEVESALRSHGQAPSQTQGTGARIAEGNRGIWSLRAESLWTVERITHFRIHAAAWRKAVVADQSLRIALRPQPLNATGGTKETHRLLAVGMFSPSVPGSPPTMASADF